jgi:hypothetical protein
MWRLALKVLAAGTAGQRLAGYAKNLTARYSILAVALIVALAGVGFAVMAGFWALNAWTGDPMQTSLIMTAIFFFAACSIALIAYGVTREKPEKPRPVSGDPLEGVAAYLPSPEEVGRGIESAVRQHGPLPVAAAAIAGGFVAAVLTRKFTRPAVVYGYEPRYRRRGRR